MCHHVCVLFSVTLPLAEYTESYKDVESMLTTALPVAGMFERPRLPKLGTPITDAYRAAKLSFQANCLEDQ